MRHLKVNSNVDCPKSDVPAKDRENRLAVLFYAVLGFLIALTLFLPGEQPEYTGAAHLPCILWLLAAVFWVCITQTKPAAIKMRLFSIGADKFIYAFFAWVVLSIFINLFYGGGYRPSLNSLSVWFLFAAAYFLFRETLQRAKIIRTVFTLITAVMLAQALTGLYQQFVDIPAMQRQFDANPEAAIAAVDPSIKPDTADWELLAARLKTAVPTGTYPLSNSLGGLLACWLFICIVGRKQNTKGKRIGIYAVFAVMAFCFLLTKCRSGMVAVASGLMLFAMFDYRLHSFITKKRLAIGASVLIAAVLCLLLFSPGTGDTGKSIVNGAERSLGFRLEYWKASLGMIKDYPLFGCGSGNFKQTYTKYKLPISSEEIADPHNFAVEIASESGLPALLLFLVPLAMLCWNKMKNEKSETENDAIADDTETIPSSSLSALHYAGLLGCWAAYFFSFGLEAPMTPAAPLTATLSFPLCTFLYKPAAKSTSLNFTSVFIALVVLLVHLSAAGGISVPSTALLIWLFIAVLFNQYSHSENFHREVKGGKGSFLCIAVLVFAVLFVYLSDLLPVSQTRMLKAQLEDPLTTEVQSEELLRQVLNADRLSAELREMQANDVFRRWFDNPTGLTLEREAAEAVNDTLVFLPRSAGLRFRFAERYAMMYEKTGIDRLRQRAAELYREAIERYPNYAPFRAPFALLLWEADKKSEAVQEGKKALQLDDLMPHKDQKLKPEQRAALEQLKI
jgi:hypothetical protein